MQVAHLKKLTPENVAVIEEKLLNDSVNATPTEASYEIKITLR